MSKEKFKTLRTRMQDSLMETLGIKRSQAELALSNVFLTMCEFPLIVENSTELTEKQKEGMSGIYINEIGSLRPRISKSYKANVFGKGEQEIQGRIHFKFRPSKKFKEMFYGR